MTAIGDRKHALTQRNPIIELWRIEATDGEVLRVVDFYARSSDTLPPTGVVEFNGEEYRPAALSRGAWTSSTEGEAPTVTVSLADPRGEVVDILRAHDWLRDARATVYLIPYDQLGVPSAARVERFSVRTVTCGFGAVAVQLGLPVNEFERQAPSRVVSRQRCWNAWHRRFNPDNECNFPSDNFSGQTNQYMAWPGTPNLGVNTERVLRFGWRSLNSRRLSNGRVGGVVSSSFLKQYLALETVDPTIDWTAATRDGPYVYKVRDDWGDFDVDTRILIAAGTTRINYAFGLLVQSESDEGDYVFWGLVDPDPGPLRWRITENGATVSTLNLNDTHKYLRLTRVGDLWTAYSRSSPSVAWEQKGTATLAMSGRIRIGFVISSTAGGSNKIVGHAGWLRFNAGGPAKCDRLQTTCEGYENIHQFNGFPRTPSSF